MYDRRKARFCQGKRREIPRLQKAGNPPLAAGEKVASAAFFEGGKGATGHGTAGKRTVFCNAFDSVGNTAPFVGGAGDAVSVICCLQRFRFASGKPSTSVIASDEKCFRHRANAFVRYCPYKFRHLPVDEICLFKKRRCHIGASCLWNIACKTPQSLLNIGNLNGGSPLNRLRKSCVRR